MNTAASHAVSETTEFYETLIQLDSDAQGDLLDTAIALAKGEVDSDAIMAEAKLLCRLRTIGKRFGIRIQKKFYRSFGCSGYMLMDITQNFIFAGSSLAPFSLTLADITDYLTNLEDTHNG